MATSKSQFLNKVSDTVVKLALLVDEVNNEVSVYTSRTYGTTDAIIDKDLSDSGSNLTAAQFNSIVVPLLANFQTFGTANKIALDKSRKDI